MYKEIVIGLLLIFQGSSDFYKINKKVNIIFKLNLEIELFTFSIRKVLDISL